MAQLGRGTVMLMDFIWEIYVSKLFFRQFTFPMSACSPSQAKRLPLFIWVGPCRARLRYGTALGDFRHRTLNAKHFFLLARKRGYYPLYSEPGSLRDLNSVDMRRYGLGRGTFLATNWCGRQAISLPRCTVHIDALRLPCDHTAGRPPLRS